MPARSWQTIDFDEEPPMPYYCDAGERRLDAQLAADRRTGGLHHSRNGAGPQRCHHPVGA